MLITRKIGKILRGKATFTQVMLAALLGGMLGFIPGFFLPGDLGGGFMQAPGLILLLVFLVLILNANLAVFGITTLIAKLLSLVTLPLAFAAGRWLLDGPLQGLFKGLVNGKVTAWFGLEHYATTGGVTIGAVFGLVVGIVLWRTLQAFRKKMADLQESSDGYKKLASKKSTRFVTWLLFGGDKKGTATYRELYESRKQGLPIRILGIVIVAVLGAGLWSGHTTFTGPYAKSALKTTMETLNGATSELAGLDLDLLGGQVKVHDVAMADADRLDRDAFRAKGLEFDIATTDLLRRRFVIEKVVSADAQHGAPRSSPGKRIGKEPPPPPPPAGPGKTLDEYLQQAKVWKERLQQANQWLSKLAQAKGPSTETKEERDARIEREKQDGLTKVRALHLLEQVPALLVKELAFEGLQVADLQGDSFDVRASNLSSDPGLVPEPMSLSVKSKSGRYEFGFAMVNGTPQIKLGLKDLDADTFGAQLAVNGATPVKGGKLDATLAGNLGFGPDGLTVDLPLNITLRGSTLSLYGTQPTQVETLSIPLGLRGPISNPRITVDDQKLTDALVAAGRKELADQVRARADALLKGVPIPGAGGAVGGAVSDLIQGTKTPEQLAAEAKAAAEAEAKRRAEEELAKQKAALEQKAAQEKAEALKKAEEELKKRGLPGGLTDILGGKKKKDG